MIIQIKPTSAHSTDHIWKMAQVGFTEKFKPVRPMQKEEYGHTATQEEFDKFAQRPGFVQWPWQGKCKCGKIVDQKELHANGGRCGTCNIQEN